MVILVARWTHNHFFSRFICGHPCYLVGFVASSVLKRIHGGLVTFGSLRMKAKLLKLEFCHFRCKAQKLGTWLRGELETTQRTSYEQVSRNVIKMTSY
jgi:hypothetical protein